MGKVTLRPGHLVAQWYHEKETVWPATVFELAKYFFYSVEVDPEFTFGDLFQLLDREGSEFLEVVLGEHVVPLLEEARLPPESGRTQRIEFLRVYNVHEDGRLRREFDGWGPWNEPYDGAWEEHPDSPRAGSISVSLTPVHQLLALPLRYDPGLVFRDPAGTEHYRTSIDITLIDFLKAIFFDLTFCGSPAERDEMRAELDRRVEEIERGEAHLIPAEEVLGDLRERLGLDEETEET